MRKIIAWLTVLLVNISLMAVTITVHKDSIIHPINPNLFGAGDEHDQEMNVRDLDSLMSMLHVPVMRYGGFMAEYTNWEGNNFNGQSYFDFLDSTKIVVMDVEYGFDSLLRFCERHNTEPVITVPFLINDPAFAARMVEYCNGDASTEMGTIRAQRGHPEPYNVKYFGIGNEVDVSGLPLEFWGPAGPTFTVYRQFGKHWEDWSLHDTNFITKQGYADLAAEYSDSMRARSPFPIEIGACFAGCDMLWYQALFPKYSDKIDWVDIHAYPCGNIQADSAGYQKCFDQLDFPGFYGLGVEYWYLYMADTVSKLAGKDMPIYLMEYHAGDLLGNFDPYWYNYLNGIFIADMIGRFARAGVPMAGIYNIYEEDNGGDHMGIIHGEPATMRAAGWVLKAYQQYFKGDFIKSVLLHENLKCYASQAGQDSIVLFVVNQHMDSAFDADVSIPGVPIGNPINRWQITNDTVLFPPWNGTKGIVKFASNTNQSKNTFLFPKSSLSILSFQFEKIGINVKRSLYAKLFFVNRPNPFKPQTSLSYTLDSRANVELLVYDARGRLINRLFRGMQPAGHYSFQWEVPKNAAGIYIFQLKVNKRRYTRKGVLLQ